MSDLKGLERVRCAPGPPVARVTLARPEKLNALDQATLLELDRVFEHLRGQVAAGLRAVIVTGAGERAFAAGADIAELAGLDAAAALEASRRGNRVFSKIAAFPVPVIAALNGFALGGGLELALACTLRIAAEHAKLGQPEVRLGLIPGYGGTQRLPRLIGRGPALQMLLSGEPVDAATALRLGLVNQVVPAEGLMAAAEACAATIAANGPLAVQYCLEAVRAGAEGGLSQGLELESRLFGMSFATEDMKEGTRAFLEKRKPEFRGQ